GNLTQAAIMLELMEQRKNNKNSSDVSAWNLLQGEIAMAQGRHEEALPLLEKALAAQDNNYSLESLAYCHYKAGHFSQARDLYLKLIGRHSLGWEAQRCWMEAHYNLALVYESLGNKAAAKEYYEKLIHRWQQGNHELVLLAAAKENVKRL
ncbi:MAG: tetratricopeptide repeat protein, partial [Cyclobacteriaceae bacterium]|nr:tetratricopeptide repeat protein [Cyclobacteriaceae bacterium]